MISVYRRNWLMSPPIWPFTRLAVRCLFGSLPERSGFQNLRTPDDLVRVYDGNDNPLGKAYSRRETLDMLRAFTIERHEVHYFPRRFLPLGRRIPRFLHMLLDRWMGLMLYVLVRKPEYSL